MIGYFEGLHSERGIAWRCADCFPCAISCVAGIISPTRCLASIASASGDSDASCDANPGDDASGIAHGINRPAVKLEAVRQQRRKMPAVVDARDEDALRQRVVANFDGGLLSSDGGVLALREVEQRLRIADRLAACVVDRARPIRSPTALLTSSGSGS